jgi:L-ornithine N5-oxygenase
VVGISKVFGYKQKDVNPFTGEVFFPEFVNTFYHAGKETKKQLIRDLHLTNYSASDADVLDRLYHKMYMEKVQDKQRIFVHRSAEITEAKKTDADNIRIKLKKLEAPNVVEEDFSLVILATGFRNIGLGETQEPYPPILNDLVSEIELDEEGCLHTNMDYSVTLKNADGKSCFINGLCESSHGMGDAGSFSLLSLRSATIVRAIENYMGTFQHKLIIPKINTHA